MIDERSRRRPEFQQASTWITLADGQRWAFPKPYVAVGGVFIDGKPIDLTSRTTHGPEFDEAVEMIRDAETNAELIIAVMTVGAFLLLKNYDLTDDELESLFVYRFDDDKLADASTEMIKTITAVATGVTDDQGFGDGSG